MTDEHILLQAELAEIEKRQLSGAWNYSGPLDDEAAKSAHDEATRKDIRRAIEILAQLRRGNTGPAKPTSNRRTKSPTSRVKEIDPTVSALLSQLE